MEKWKIDKNHKKLLENLFKSIDLSKIKNILDVGTGRTSVYYLTNKFKKVTTEAVVYPGDKRKIEPILSSVKERNYKIIESDIKDLKNKKADLVLAHLFLGEAEKFGKNKFEEITKALFLIKTKYLVIINREDDKIDYLLLLKYISKKGKIIKIATQPSENGHEYIGIVINTEVK